MLAPNGVKKSGIPKTLALVEGHEKGQKGSSLSGRECQRPRENCICLGTVTMGLKEANESDCFRCVVAAWGEEGKHADPWIARPCE